jgi:hypothetical protein
VNLLGASFVDKDYNAHRKQQLLSLEKSLLPQAQLIIEEKKRREEEKEELYKEVLRLAERKSALRKAVEERAKDLLQQIDAIDKEMDRVRSGRDGTKPVDRKVPEKKFIRKCPAGDCKGFLSTRWVCGLCGARVCPKCGVVKYIGKLSDETDVDLLPIQSSTAAVPSSSADQGPVNEKKEADPSSSIEQSPAIEKKADKSGHICNPDNVASMALIHSETRSCPSCAACIFRIEGCDQMWCTSCNTAFNWKTLKIIPNENVHNPHYFQWLAKNPNAPHREHDDVGCGGIPDMDSIIPFIGKDAGYSYVFDFVRLLRHVRDVEVEVLNRRNEDAPMDLRVAFLSGKITEAHWGTQLATKARKEEYNHNALQILNMLLNAGSDLLRNIETQHKAGDIPAVNGSLESIYNLIAYVNEEFRKLSRLYKRKPFSIENEKGRGLMCIRPGTKMANMHRNREAVRRMGLDDDDETAADEAAIADETADEAAIAAAILEDV